jgi:hypothetical protein
MSAAFHDLREAEFRRHEQAHLRRGNLALLRNATASSDEKQTAEHTDIHQNDVDAERAKRLIGDYGHTTDAASLLLAGANCPPEHRGFIDAVVGVAGDRTEWFSVTDDVLAKRAGRSTKWVQTHRKELLEWEHKNDITFIEIEDSYTDADGTRHAHKYRVHLAKYAADTKLDAEHSAEWYRNPGKALEAAAETYRDSLPTMPARKKRRRAYTPSAAQIIERELKRARTCLEKVLNLQPMDGSLAAMNAELLATLQGQLAQLTGTSTRAETTVQISSTREREALEHTQIEEPRREPERVEAAAVETEDLPLLEKSSTRENIGVREDLEVSDAGFDASPADSSDTSPPDFDIARRKAHPATSIHVSSGSAVVTEEQMVKW